MWAYCKLIKKGAFPLSTLRQISPSVEIETKPALLVGLGFSDHLHKNLVSLGLNDPPRK